MRYYRRALDRAFGFGADPLRARILGAAFFLAVAFFAPGLALGLGLGVALGFTAPLGLLATNFAPRGWVSCACAAANRAIGTRNGEQET